MFKIRYWKKSLAFEYPFTISKGTKTHQPIFVVELEWRGIKAYGEAPAISYYGITVDQMADDLTAKIKFVESFSFTEPKRFWHFLHHLFPKNPFLVCALDMAGWDLFAKIRNKPLYAIWNLIPSQSPITDYTIGIAEHEEMLKKIKHHPAPIYKIKVGSQDDLNTLVKIRNYTDAILRVDANAGWQLDQAKTMLPVLEEIGIELIEQPFAKDAFEETKLFAQMTEIPIVADESCVGLSDIDKCIGVFDVINIKLTKSSGITPAIDMIKRARQHGLKIMLGSMNESSIGTAALAHLAPMVDYLDADGPLLLKEDLVTGITYTDFHLVPSALPGLGIQVIPTEFN
jgi:L-alanine-DL-glutamate epimerase-like enolase superfamily enzyme